MRPPTRRRMLAMLLGGAGLAGILYKARARISRMPLIGGMSPPPSEAGGAPIVAGAIPTLLALGDVLIPSTFSSVGSQGYRAPVRTVLQESLQAEALRARAFQEDAEAAARFLDQQAQKDAGMSFGALEFARRRTMADTLLGGRAPKGREPARVRRVASAMIHAFYVSRYGWISMGYSHGRGECTDLVDYQNPPRPGLGF